MYVAFEVTTAQQRLLNDISKYEPAWRNFSTLNGEGFGDKMKSLASEIITLKETNILGIKEVDLNFSSLSEITVFENSNIFISDITINILEQFSSLATLSIGDDFNQELLVKENECDLNEINKFIIAPKLNITNTIKLFYNSMGSSIGNAKVIFNLR